MKEKEINQKNWLKLKKIIYDLKMLKLSCLGDKDIEVLLNESIYNAEAAHKEIKKKIEE